MAISNVKTVFVAEDRPVRQPVQGPRNRLPDWLYRASYRTVNFLKMDLEDLGLTCTAYRNHLGHFIVAIDDGQSVAQAVEGHGSQHMARTISLWWPDLTDVVSIHFDATAIAQIRDSNWREFKEWSRSAHTYLLAQGLTPDHPHEFDVALLDDETLTMLEQELGPMPLRSYPLSAAIYPSDSSGAGTAWAIFR